ncbi:cytochrome b561 domain-containing protein [uncultured Tateyamaria sp.]|uniref:cytochrome b561 domain-containing protein n=1 Tax=uncultured Tateyamaria sp. TaxID=455651 RepID=UPI00260FE065|nr:cytochrome b561 domain-containing protein [uncultured Tateyamaria sp.]
MWEWLSAPIDPARAHEVGLLVSWHARMMVLAWGVLAPLAVIFARFFKIMPRQNWPVELDHPFWWRCHWIGQSAVFVLSIVGFALVLPPDFQALSTHTALGYLLLLGLVAQVMLGIFRGNKGGPTELRKQGSMRGHHYDMTGWRRMFEWLHKSLGYALLALSVAVIALGLWKANAPLWMWGVLGIWWCFLVGLYSALQKRGMAVDTYQAIWGPDPSHPGNRLPAPGWGVQRPANLLSGTGADVDNLMPDGQHTAPK